MRGGLCPVTRPARPFLFLYVPAHSKRLSPLHPKRILALTPRSPTPASTPPRLPSLSTTMVRRRQPPT